MDTVDPAQQQFLRQVRESRVRPGELAMWYLGGAGYIVRTDRAIVVIDPFLGPSNPPSWIRAVPPAFAADDISELGPIDAVLLSHEHGDHTDPVALQALALHTTAPVYGPASCVAAATEAGFPADRLHQIDHGETVTLAELKVTAVPMVDPLAQGCNGYVMETGAVTVLHCGDGIYSGEFLDAGQRWQFDAMCVSVGTNPPGKSLYMDEADAARAARDAKVRTLVLQHYDLWEGITIAPRRIRTVVGWYAPETTVLPARFGRRLTIAPAG